MLSFAANEAHAEANKQALAKGTRRHVARDVTKIVDINQQEHDRRKQRKYRKADVSKGVEKDQGWHAPPVNEPSAVMNAVNVLCTEGRE